MSNVKNKITQIVIGSLSLVMIVLCVLCMVSIIPTVITDWIWGILAICFAFNLVEVIIYFVFKADVRFIICKWVLLLFAVLILALSTIGLITGATEMFSVFSALSGWFNFVLILLAYAITIIQILAMIGLTQEEKEVRLAKRNANVEEDVENK